MIPSVSRSRRQTSWSESKTSLTFEIVGSYDCAGLYGPTCGTPTPKWRHKARVNWSSPYGLDLAVTWRYYDRVKNDGLDSNPLLNSELEQVGLGGLIRSGK